MDRPGTQTKARCLIRQKHEKRIGEAWDNRDREIREIPTDRPSAGREGPATDSHPPRLITPETHRPAKRASGPDRMRHLAANRRRSFTRLGRRSPQREHRRSIPNPTALLIPQEERGTFSGSTPTLPSVRRRKDPLHGNAMLGPRPHFCTRPSSALVCPSAAGFVGTTCLFSHHRHARPSSAAAQEPRSAQARFGPRPFSLVVSVCPPAATPVGVSQVSHPPKRPKAQETPPQGLAPDLLQTTI